MSSRQVLAEAALKRAEDELAEVRRHFEAALVARNTGARITELSEIVETRISLGKTVTELAALRGVL